MAWSGQAAGLVVQGLGGLAGITGITAQEQLAVTSLAMAVAAVVAVGSSGNGRCSALTSTHEWSQACCSYNQAGQL